MVKIQEEVMEEGEVRDILQEMSFEVPAPSPRCFFHPKKELKKRLPKLGLITGDVPWKNALSLSVKIVWKIITVVHTIQRSC